MISILYVDDEPDLLEICRIFLEQTGEFRVDTVESSGDALARLKKTRYDIVISDFQMPDMDGITLLKTIRELYGDMPFILFTGKGREEVVIDAVNNGADFYIQKGGDPRSQFAELIHKIRQATNKRKAERNLVESEKRLYDIINFLPDATFAIDRNGEVIAWNRAIEDLTGIPAADMIGKGDHAYAIPFYGHRRPLLIDLIFRPDEEIKEKYSHIRRENKVLIAESDLPRPQGRQLIIRGKASALYDNEGNLAGAIESIRDITAVKHEEDELKAAYDAIAAADRELREQYERLKQNEQVIRDSEEKYRILVENSDEVIWIYRGDSFLHINKRGSEVTGYSREELMKMKVWDFLHPDDRERVFAAAKSRMQGADIPKRYKARIITKSGNAVPMDLVGVLITYQGEPAIMGIAQDVTQREAYINAMSNKTKTLTIINRIIEIASRRRDMDELLNTALSSIRDHLEYDGGGIYLIDESTGRARIVCSQDLPEEFLREVENIDIHAAPYSAVLVSGSRDIREHLGTVNPDYAKKYGMKSVASIPIIAEERVTGAINLASRTRSEIPDNEQEVLSVIGRELGSAIMRVKAEAALEESEALYRTLIETTGTGFGILDDTGRVIDANPEYVRQTGHTDLAEIKGKAVSEWTAPHDRKRTLDAFRDCLDKGYIRNLEIDHAAASGRILPVEINATVITGKGPARIVTLCRDISSRRAAENALRESERQYHSIVENIQDMFYRTDAEGRITMVTPSGARQAGYNSPEEMIGLDIAKTLYADPQERKKLLTILAKKGAVTAYPLVLKAKDGQQIYVTASSHIFRDEDGRILGVEGILHDVTHIRQAEAALKEANRKLNLLNSITRHDVANQLTVLQGYLQLAEMRNPDPIIGDFLKKIESVTTTIGRQIEFSKEYQELGVKAPDWFSLDEIFARNRPKDILFSSTCTDVGVFADPMLEKVFANLFGNSIMHGERVSRITVHCESANGSLLIVVEDNGVGVPLDLKQKIFHKGFGKNTGFGLFLAREILAITGITIHETGTHGKGARFEIVVPKGGFRYENRSESHP